jgi:hypothetical protein
MPAPALFLQYHQTPPQLHLRKLPRLLMLSVLVLPSTTRVKKLLVTSFPRSASVSKNILQVELCSRSVSKRISAKCHGLALLGMERCKSEKMSGLALRYRDEKQKR